MLQCQRRRGAFGVQRRFDVVAAERALEAGGARRLGNESFFSAPQLKRDPLGRNHREGSGGGLNQMTAKVQGRAVHKLLNRSTHPAVVVLEPWGGEYDIGPNQALDLVVEGDL